MRWLDRSRDPWGQCDAHGRPRDLWRRVRFVDLAKEISAVEALLDEILMPESLAAD